MTATALPRLGMEIASLDGMASMDGIGMEDATKLLIGPPDSRREIESKAMKVNQMDTTKEGVKTYLEIAAEQIKEPWYSQAAHKRAVCLWVLDCLEIKDQETRNAFGKQFMSTPSSFAANASALGQALGRPKAASSTDAINANF